MSKSNWFDTLSTYVERKRPPMVAAQWGCPECGERVMDRLVWSDDAAVECATCGAVYEPESEEAVK